MEEDLSFEICAERENVNSYLLGVLFGLLEEEGLILCRGRTQKRLRFR